MNRVELSLHIEASYPANKLSIAMRKPMCGIGVNDAHYMTTPRVNGVKLMDPAYRDWANMLARSYDPKFHKKQPTYLDVTVCTQWHSFSSFRVWWLTSCREGYSLDKDLLSPGNREYGPDTCVYVPQWLNKFTTDSGAARGDLPIGVSLYKKTGKYRSHCCNPITHELHCLGYFKTPEEAHDAWLKYKLAIADQLKPDMDAIDKRIYNNVVTIINSAR